MSASGAVEQSGSGETSEGHLFSSGTTWARRRGERNANVKFRQEKIELCGAECDQRKRTAHHTPRVFEHVGKIVFCGKAKRSKKQQGEPEAEEGMEDQAP